MQKALKINGNLEYMASGRWKCKKSPSGAHYWIVQKLKMTCKYCQLSKQTDSQEHGITRPAGK